MIRHIIDGLEKFVSRSGFVNITFPQIIMLIIAGILIYLAIKKEYEPLLLLPIGFGTLLTNLPLTGLTNDGGLFNMFYWGIKSGLFPPLI
ncbi:MAG TPA: sodium ion-translocating decarboxylase subunit beta, partial [bacterium]|nr:sodium ion-translocating decarboxylase subunit beta [bacterium]